MAPKKKRHDLRSKKKEMKVQSQTVKPGASLLSQIEVPKSCDIKAKRRELYPPDGKGRRFDRGILYSDDFKDFYGFVINELDPDWVDRNEFYTKVLMGNRNRMASWTLKFKADDNALPYYVFAGAQDGIEIKELEQKAKDLKKKFDQLLRESNERQETLQSLEIYMKLISQYPYQWPNGTLFESLDHGKRLPKRKTGRGIEHMSDTDNSATISSIKEWYASSGRPIPEEFQENYLEEPDQNGRGLADNNIEGAAFVQSNDGEPSLEQDAQVGLELPGSYPSDISNEIQTGFKQPENGDKIAENQNQVKSVATPSKPTSEMRSDSESYEGEKSPKSQTQASSVATPYEPTDETQSDSEKADESEKSAKSQTRVNPVATPSEPTNETRSGSEKAKGGEKNETQVHSKPPASGEPQNGMHHLHPESFEKDRLERSQIPLANSDVQLSPRFLSAVASPSATNNDVLAAVMNIAGIDDGPGSEVDVSDISCLDMNELEKSGINLQAANEVLKSLTALKAAKEEKSQSQKCPDSKEALSIKSFPGSRFGATMTQSEILAYESLVSESPEGPCIKNLTKLAHYLPKIFVMLTKLLDINKKQEDKIDNIEQELTEMKSLYYLGSSTSSQASRNLPGSSADLDPPPNLELEKCKKFPLRSYEEIDAFFSDRENLPAAISHIRFLIVKEGILNVKKFTKVLLRSLFTTEAIRDYNWGFEKDTSKTPKLPKSFTDWYWDEFAPKHLSHLVWYRATGRKSFQSFVSKMLSNMKQGRKISNRPQMSLDQQEAIKNKRLNTPKEVQKKKDGHKSTSKSTSEGPRSMKIRKVYTPGSVPPKKRSRNDYCSSSSSSNDSSSESEFQNSSCTSSVSEDEFDAKKKKKKKQKKRKNKNRRAESSSD